MGAKSDIVKRALKLVEEHIAPGTEQYAKNLDAFYGATHPNYRQKYYTGTSKDKDFTAFQESRHGTWLTNNPSEASDYALENDSQNLRLIPGTWKYEKVNDASRVIPGYARVENPYTGELPDNVKADNYKKAQSEWFDQLRSQGYDAWAPDSRKGDLLVVLKDQGTNVKSAIGNNGQFDRSKKHLAKAGGGGLIDDAVRLATKAVEGEAAPAVPKLFGDGYKVGIHPQADDYTRKLGDYLNSRNPDLPVDAESIAARRQDTGHTVDAYHGSPRDIHGFDNKFSTPEGYWGGHHYFTSNPVDASKNYATRNGADLINRMGTEKENILNGFHPDDVRQWYASKYGDASGIDPTDSKLVNEWGDDMAAEALGITNHGAVYPAALRMKNPVRIDSPNQTFWDHVIEQDDNGDILSEGGPAADLLQHTQDVLGEYGLGDSEITDVMGRLSDELYGNGGIDAGTYDALMRKYAIYGTDDNGNMVSPGHLMSDVFQRMGHDSIDMPTHVFAGTAFRKGMEGTGGNTRHYIIFDPKNIRSRFGLFDPFKANSKRLSDARGGRVEREGYATKGAVLKKALSVAEDVIGGRTPTEVFPDLANRYPEVGPPEWKIDKKKGEGYWAKKLTPEALAVQKARKAIQADIDKGNYSPFFDPTKRTDVDPRNYPATGATLTDAMPVKPETQAKWRAKAFNPEGLQRLRAGYEAGLKQKDVAENWYFMKQLEDEFVKELGPVEGRKQFKARFAKGMATTTGGADPTDNLMMAYYGNWMANKGEAIPETHQMPFPIGGRYVGGNMEMFEKNIGNELTTDNPKRFNFQNNFPGHKQPTIDEQMSKGFDPKLNMPEWYGPYEEAINHLAAEYKVDPRYFQEVGWAGLKSMTPEGYKGKPMIGHVNEAIERTSRITGVPPAEVVRRGLVRGEMPIYGFAAPAAGAIAVGAMGDEEDPAEAAVRVAKAGGGGFLREAAERLLGKAEREGLGGLTPPGSGYASVPGKPATVLLPGIGRVEAKPLSPVMEAAHKYMAERGMPGAHDVEAFPEFDPELATRIGREYDKMPHAPHDPAVRRAYEAMAQETLDQFKAAKDTGLDFRAIRGDDPYAASPAIGYADAAERGTLSFFPTDSGFGSGDFDASQNPLLKRVGRIGDLDNATVNDAFRIVHDLYGHYGPGNPFFRAPGEERAFKLHSRMYSPDALPAMTSETRGQNSWLNYGPHGETNRKALGADTIFADQKTGLMPPWTYDWEGRIRKADGGGLTPYADAPEFAWRRRFAADNPDSPEVNEMVTSVTDDELKRQFDDASAWQKGQDYIDQRRAENPGMYGNPNANEPTISSRPSTLRETAYNALPTELSRGVADSLAPVGDAINFATGAEDFGDAWYKFAQTGETPSMEDRAWMAVNMAPAVVGAAAKPVWGAAKAAFKAVPDVVKGGLAGAGALTAMPDEAEAGKLNLFSRLGRSIEDLPMDKMSAEQALSMLARTAPGSELKWTGTLDYLRNNPKVTKSGLLAHLEANKVEPHETALGEGVVYPSQLVPRPEIRAKYADELEKARSKSAWYGLSGRKEDRAVADAAYRRVYELEKQMRDEELALRGGYDPAPRYEQWSTGDFNTNSYREHVFTLPGTDFVSPHFNDAPTRGKEIPGYIAHMRGGMHSEDGKRFFIMDEAQSDLAQKLRKDGPLKMGDMKLVDQGNGYWGFEMPGGRFAGGYGTPEHAQEMMKKRVIDYTPYTDNTDDWTDLAVKRAIQAANEGDATHLAWPTGRVQNDRYDMRHQMNALHYRDNMDGTYTIDVEDPDGGMNTVLDRVDADEVRRTVGDNIWQRIQNNEGRLDDFVPNARRLPMNGEVLENRGMNKYYDEIVPKRVGAVVKKATGEKVNIGKAELSNKQGFGNYHVVPLTKETKSAKFSSFDRGGTVARALALVNED